MVNRKAAIEALTVAYAVSVIKLRNNRDRSADVVLHGGRQYRQIRYRKYLADSAQSETPGMHGNFTRENRETLWPCAAGTVRIGGRRR